MGRYGRFACMILYCAFLMVPKVGYSANRYWIGNLLNTNYNNSSNWSTTSGGSGGASVPGTSDTAIFNSASLFDCTLNVNVNVAAFRVSSGLLKTVTQTTNTITATHDAVFYSGVFVAGSGDITVGNLTVNGLAFTSTLGTLTISGNLSVNTLTFAQAAGNVIMNGSSLQTISVQGLINIVGFYNLKVDNSGAGIKLNTDIKVTNILYMKQGNIALNSKTITLGIINATGTLTYNSGFMTGLGTFSRWFPVTTSILYITIGDPAGLFPMGEGSSSNRFVWIGASAGVISTQGIISVSHTNTPGTTNVTSPYLDAGSTMTSYFSTSWYIRQSGLVLDILGGGIFSIRIQGDDLGPVANCTRLHMTNGNSALGTHSAGTGSNQHPQVNRTGCDLLGHTFYISADSVNALPVKLISFNAKRLKQGNYLKWITASEINYKQFELEFRTDKDSFHTIDIQAGAGTSSTGYSYEYIHDTDVTGICYYRLKQVDYNGSYEYSKIISLNCGKMSGKQPAGDVEIYPNPVARGKAISLQFNNLAADYYIIEIVDQQGITLYKSNMHVDTNTGNNRFDLSGMEINKTGLYYLRIISPFTLINKKFNIL